MKVATNTGCPMGISRKGRLGRRRFYRFFAVLPI